MLISQQKKDCSDKFLCSIFHLSLCLSGLRRAFCSSQSTNFPDHAKSFLTERTCVYRLLWYDLLLLCDWMCEVMHSDAFPKASSVFLAGNVFCFQFLFLWNGIICTICLIFGPHRAQSLKISSQLNGKQNPEICLALKQIKWNKENVCLNK